MQPSKSHQAALTPGYDWSEAQPEFSKWLLHFYEKERKNHFTSAVCDSQPVLPLDSEHQAWVQQAEVCTALPSPGQSWAAAALPPCAARQKCGSGGCGSWAVWKLKGGWESREVWPFDCCRCFCQYCAFADLVSFSTTNFSLVLLEADLFGGFVWLIRSVLL